MKVSQLMTRDVVTCGKLDDLARAAQLMWEHDVGALPVVDEDGHVAGMITDRDIAMAAYTRGVPLHEIPALVAMAQRVFTCTAEDDLAAVEKTMRECQIRRMPVVDRKGHPVGIIALNDLARASAGAAEVTPSEVASTLAAVCAPRRPVVAAA
jgi:CBS domain-containing protein